MGTLREDIACLSDSTLLDMRATNLDYSKMTDATIEELWIFNIAPSLVIPEMKKRGIDGP